MPAQSTPTADIQVVSQSFAMMATTVEIKVAAPAARAEDASRAIERAAKAMQAFVDVVNAWDPKSDLSRVNTNAGKAPVRIDPRLMEILLRCRDLSEESGGAFDVTFFPLGLAWNLCTANPTIPDAAKIADAKALVNYRDLVLDPKAGTASLRRAGMRVELGAIAKGAAADVGSRSLRESGFPNSLVRASGDMYVSGTKGDKPWIVGIRNPRGSRGDVLGAFAVRDRAVTTSGDYEKMVIINGKRYHHIIDPRTGWPAAKSISVSVIARDGEAADGLSTTLFVLGPKDGLDLCRRLRGVEALFVDPEGKIFRTPGFPAFMERKEPK